MTPDATLQQAVQRHQAGAFAEAEQLYRTVLQMQPDHPDANHRLGMLAVQLEQHAMGLPFLKAAHEAGPQREDIRRDYLEALERAGQPEAAARVREAARPQGAAADPGVATLTDDFIATITRLTSQGDRARAEAIGRQMTQLLPEHGFGWKTLAHGALSRGDLDAARIALQHAVRLLPQDTSLHSHLRAADAMHDARALDEAGDYERAEPLYRIVIERYPQYPDALHKLAVVLIRLRQPDAAVPLLQIAIGVNPNQPQYWLNYVDALLQSGQTRAAWIALEMGQQRGMAGPAVDALIQLMSSLPEGGKIVPVPVTRPPKVAAEGAAQAPAALPAAGSAAGSVPASPPAATAAAADARRPSQQECDKAVAHFNQGRLDQAVTAGRSLTQRFPSQPLGWKILGCGCYRLGQYEESFEALRTASQLAPLDVEVLQAWVSLLLGRNMHTEAESACRAMLNLEPDNHQGHRVMGVALLAQRRLKEAEHHTRTSIAADNGASGSYVTLGAIMLQQGRQNDAAMAFRRALEVHPDNNIAFENLNFCLTHSEEIGPEELFAEHVRYAEYFEKPLKKQWKPHRNRKDPNRPLHVGFISGDFRAHAVMSFLEPMLEHLAKDSSLILHAYSSTPGEDHITARLRPYFAHWHHIFGGSDDNAAKQIRADGIDILVDLAGHTAHNRLLAMARKPAPVQATWIGYPGTTGLSSVDYFFADPFWVPSEAFARFFTEKIVYLPAVAPFQRETLSPPVNGLPALRNGYVTFGSFNRIEKLRRDVIELWAQVLHAVPRSRMIIASMPKDTVPDELIEWFTAAGIARERLEFKPRASVAVYLQQHYHVDICLDTFPFTGLTTTMQALWMGVPTLTLPGRTVPGRSGVTALSHVGLQSFIADDRDDYVRRAVAHASDVPALAALRAGMRERCEQSPMFRPERIAADFTQALRVMWRRWCEGKPAESFDVGQRVDATPAQTVENSEAA